MSLDRFIQDGQDPKVVEKIYGKVKDMLTNGESIKYIAIQKKPAVTLLPDCILISNRRIFLCEFTKLGLSNNFEIFVWKDIKDIAFKEEIFGSKVTVIPSTGENLSIDYIPKTQARKLFQLIKDALETSKEEELAITSTTTTTTTTVKDTSQPISPIRDIYGEVTKHEDAHPKVEESAPFIAPKTETNIPEEKTTNTWQSTPSITPPAPIETTQEEIEDEITIKLKKLKNLYDKQLITQAEYESKKAEILEQL